MHELEAQPFTRLPIDAATVRSPLTLAVDCGGGSIKAAVCNPDGTLVSSTRRVRVEYPFTVNQWLQIIGRLLADAKGAGLDITRMSVGLPGMIRSGRIIYTPHYIRSSGPHTEISLALASEWNGLDAAHRLHERFGVPSRVVNDAEMHGAALIRGTGLEVTLTFGTGLGSAHFLDGVLQAHLELSHAQFLADTTYDQYIGEHVRVEIGNQAWGARVLEVVGVLYPVFRWDTVFIGGGNAHNLTAIALQQLTELGHDVRVVANRVALSGGPKLWG